MNKKNPEMHVHFIDGMVHITICKKFPMKKYLFGKLHHENKTLMEMLP
jgi:hypothetical protein